MAGAEAERRRALAVALIGSLAPDLDCRLVASRRVGHSGLFVRDPLLEPVRGEPEYPAMMELARQRQQAFLKRLH